MSELTPKDWFNLVAIFALWILAMSLDVAWALP